MTCVGSSAVVHRRAFLGDEVGVSDSLGFSGDLKPAVEEAVSVVGGFGEDGNRWAGATGGKVAFGFGEK